jgi:hypothetical protein
MNKNKKIFQENKLAIIEQYEIESGLLPFVDSVYDLPVEREYYLKGLDKWLKNKFKLEVK